MKVALLSSAANRHTERWARWLRELGHEVVVMSDKPPRADFDFTGVRVVHPTWSLWNNLLVFKIKGGRYANNREKWRVYQPLIDRERPDIIHAHEALAYGPTLDHFREYPRVLTPWGPDMECQWGSEEADLVKQAVNAADVISTNGPGMEEEWAAQFGIPQERIMNFSWGIDVDVFRPRSMEEQKAIRARVGVPENVPLLVSPRLAKPYYNVDVLLSAWREEEAGLGDAWLVVLRAGADDESWSALKLLGGDRVRFVEESLAPAEMAALFSTASAVAMLPKTDLLAMSLLEALGCGALPIVPDHACYRSVVSDIAGVAPEDNAAACITVASLDVEGVREALRRWRSQQGEWWRAGNIASIQRDHDRRVCTQRINEVYAAARRNFLEWRAG